MPEEGHPRSGGGKRVVYDRILLKIRAANAAPTEEKTLTEPQGGASTCAEVIPFFPRRPNT